MTLCRKIHVSEIAGTESSQVAENFAISKAASVLEAIANSSGPANIADLARQLRMPRQTVHRILTQLSAVDLIVRDGARQRFSVGPRLRALSLSALLQTQADEAANLVLRALVGELHETCNVGVLDGDSVVYLCRVECDWPLRVQLRPGSRVPAYCTAIGKLLLAHLPNAHRTNVLHGLQTPRITPYTLTSPRELEQDLQETTRRGYSINNQEDSLGLIAVAVPITDTRGRVVAGLAVHAPEARLSVVEATKRLPLLRRAATELSTVLFT